MSLNIYRPIHKQWKTFIGELIYCVYILYIIYIYIYIYFSAGEGVRGRGGGGLSGPRGRETMNHELMN